MKKIVALVFAFVLLCSLASCNTNAPDTEPEISNKTPEELISEGNYLDAYKALLAKGDEASKAELEKFVFLPTQTVETDRFGRVYTYDYTWDAEGRPLKVVATQGETTRESTFTYGDGSFSFSNNGTLSKAYTLNEAGLITRLELHRSDGEINVTVYEYDENERLIQSTETIPGNDSPTIIRYTYDDKGRLALEEYGYGDDAADTTTYTYDDSGKLIKTVEVIPSDGNTYETTYTYNEKGLLVSESVEKTDRNGNKEHRSDKTYTYDKNGRVLSALEVLADDGYTSKDEWSYDELGNLTKVVEAWGYSDSLNPSTLEHKDYKVFYLPDPHAVLDEVLESFQPELD